MRSAWSRRPSNSCESMGGSGLRTLSVAGCDGLCGPRIGSRDALSKCHAGLHTEAKLCCALPGPLDELREACSVAHCDVALALVFLGTVMSPVQRTGMPLDLMSSKRQPRPKAYSEKGV